MQLCVSVRDGSQSGDDLFQAWLILQAEFVQVLTRKHNEGCCWPQGV